MMTTRDEALATLTAKGAEKTTTGARVYYTLLGSRMIPYEPKVAEQKIRGGVNAAVLTAASLAPMAARRTRKALGIVLKKLLARGVLSEADVDDIRLAAVGYEG